MILSQIAACSSNRVIGRENQLPWHLPEDLQYFKNKTSGKIIIMGRKTFESFPKPLPKRLHIVISRSSNLKSDNPLVLFVNSLEEAIDLANKHIPNWSEEVFVIGGGQIYKASLPLCQRVYLTEIDLNVSGDAYYPELGSDFKLTEKHKGNDSIATYFFCTYERTIKR